MINAKYRGYVEGPRWAGLSTAIKNSAHMLNIELDISVDTSFFTESVRFSVSGNSDSVIRFKEWFNESCKEYNN